MKLESECIKQIEIKKGRKDIFAVITQSSNEPCDL